MVSILVTGASRGIGLEIVKKLVSHPDSPKLILATCRNPDSATELTELSKKCNNVKVLKLDVSKFDSYPEFVKTVSSIVKENGLNVLINNAGIMHKTKGFKEIPSFELYVDTFQTNLYGPVFLTQALLPLIKKAAADNSDKPMGIKRAAVLNVSSLLGSVSLGEQKGLYLAYSESKAALNSATRSLSKNLKEFGILALPLHPGWVKTELGGEEAPVPPEESGQKLVNLIYGLTEKDNDTFLSWEGKIVPW